MAKRRTLSPPSRRFTIRWTYEFYPRRFFSMILLWAGLYVMFMSWAYIYGLGREAGWIALGAAPILLLWIWLHRSRWRLLVFAVGAAMGLSWLVLAFALP